MELLKPSEPMELLDLMHCNTASEPTLYGQRYAINWRQMIDDWTDYAMAVAYLQAIATNLKVTQTFLAFRCGVS